MIMISVVAPTNWTQLITVVNILAVAGIFGGINGVLLAGQKWYSWTDTPEGDLPPGDYPPLG